MLWARVFVIVLYKFQEFYDCMTLKDYLCLKPAITEGKFGLCDYDYDTQLSRLGVCYDCVKWTICK